MMLRFTVATIFVIFSIIPAILGHGRLMQPTARSSVWRVDSRATPNYNDDQTNCGGKGVQWDQLGGKCGLCGDTYTDPHPQANENTGTYGQGIIVAEYSAGSTIDVAVELTTNHMGFFNFSLCVLEDPSSPEPGEECFVPLTLGDGSTKFVLTNTEEIHSTTWSNTTVKLPDGLTCDRCVFRWHYNTGNGWGQCDDGTSAIGCGAQETFISCADISIA